MEENFSMEWNIFKYERKKIASMEYGRIVFHSTPCPGCDRTYGIILYINSESISLTKLWKKVEFTKLQLIVTMHFTKSLSTFARSDEIGFEMFLVVFRSTTCDKNTSIKCVEFSRTFNANRNNLSHHLKLT